MSTNILFPLLIVAANLFVALAAHSRTRQRHQPKIFKLQVPKKKKGWTRSIKTETDIQEETNAPQGETLVGWHNKHEVLLLDFFEQADKVMSQSHSAANEKVAALEKLPNVEHACVSHPAPEIGAELATLVGILNTGCTAFSRNDEKVFSDQRLLYLEYRSTWLSRIRQYVHDFERLIHLRKPLP